MQLESQDALLCVCPLSFDIVYKGHQVHTTSLHGDTASPAADRHWMLPVLGSPDIPRRLLTQAYISSGGLPLEGRINEAYVDHTRLSW